MFKGRRLVLACCVVVPGLLAPSLAGADVAPSRGVPLIARTAGPNGVLHAPVGFNDITYDGIVPGNGLTAAELANNLSWYQGGHETIARYTVNWAWAQGAAGAHESWYFDSVVKNWLDHGIKVLLTVIGSPTFAISGTDFCPSATWCPPSDDPIGQSEFGSFLTDLTRHVTGIGDSPSDNPYTSAEAANIAGIEIWNEPNLTWAWQTKLGPDAARYTRLLTAGYNGVKAVAPSLPVIGGALSNFEGPSVTAGNQSLHDFLNLMLTLSANTHMDGLSIHNYDVNDNPVTDPQAPPPATPTDLFDRTIRTNVKGVLQNYTENGQPLNGRMHIWITEMGASTTGSCAFPAGWHTCKLQDQSDDVRNDYHQYDANFPDVDAMFIHTLQDLAGTAPDAGYGLINNQPPMSSPVGTTFSYKCSYTNISYDLQQLGFPGTTVSGPVTCPSS